MLFEVTALEWLERPLGWVSLHLLRYLVAAGLVKTVLQRCLRHRVHADATAPAPAATVGTARRADVQE
jgi:hypothetical protein